MAKEYELVKVGHITYTNKNIISKNGFGLVENTIPYEEIDSFYIRTKVVFVNYYNIGFKRFITIITKDKKKYDLLISYGSLGLVGSFESKHVAFIKKMAPQAKFIKKEKINQIIKRKLKQIDTFFKSNN